ncbi:MAG: DUF4199 domain-containing protein [Thermoanaerobaculaceae bacterium]
MSPQLKGGLAIGIGCVAWTFVMGLTGWYTHPALLNLFWVVVVIEIAALVWGLGLTSGLKRYWGQVGAGTVMSVIGAVVIFCGSLLFTTVAFPNYFAELRAVQEQMLQARGLAADEVARQVAAAAAFQTPLVQALMGAVGTVVTGFVASLVIAAFRRAR